MAHERCMLGKQGYARAPAHTRTQKLLFRCNNGYAIAPQYYVVLRCLTCLKFC
jgi:hypothetical protein